MRKARSNSTRCFQPAVETLDMRLCPAVSIGVRGQTLFIHGDAAANAVVINDDGAGNVTASIDGMSVTGANIHRIRVNTGDGNDSITYTLANALGTSERLSIEAGDGNDAITLNLAPGVAAGGSLRVGVEAGNGANTVTTTLGAIAAGGKASVNVETGDGDSTLSFAFAGSLDGSLHTKFESGDGNNTINATYTLDPASTGSLRSKIEVGDGNNNLTMNITGSDALKKLKAHIETGNGMNTITNTANIKVDLGVMASND